MADPARYRYMDAAGRRSPPLQNPARASMPLTGGGYSSLYSGDLHAMSASHHEGLSSRPADEYRTSAVPVNSTTYTVRKEPLSRSTSVNDGTRVHRILDNNPKRPIIVTTKHHPSGPRSSSPSRDPRRSSDEGQYYAQPASSIPRSRVGGHVPSSAVMDDDEYQRLRDRTHYDRLGHRGSDPYRAPRQGPLYAEPSHRANTYDFDDEGYEYTKPSDLARYDLDHDRRRGPRRESVDRYVRPTFSISTDLARPYDQGERRVRGPPPTTWGLDKVNRAAAGGIYDGAGSHMPLPSNVPPPPDIRRPGLLEPPGSPREEHRGGPRPLSMIQDDPRRSGHPDDYYYDDLRDLRDRGFGYFQDDSVTARGFGIRVDSNDLEDRRQPENPYRDERRDRREPQKRYEAREPRRRSDEDLEIITHEHEDRNRRRRRDHNYAIDDDVNRDRKDARPSDDEPDGKKEKLPEKVAAGVGVAAAAASLGLSSALRSKDDKGKENPPPPRRNGAEDADRRRLDGEADARTTPSRKEPLLGDEEFEIVDHPSDREKPRDEPAPGPPTREPNKNADASPSSPRDHSSSTDEGRSRTRRRPRASSFDPNDTAALAEMKARLNASDSAQKAEGAPVNGKERPSGKDSPPANESSPERTPPPVQRREGDSGPSAVVRKDDGRSHDLAPPERDETQVRVVSPPKETVPEKKPIKGILKQPKAKFPEEPNPVREGVAPHRDDKTKVDVPPGARWTKISRKMVNPEALTIGKERFEIRDDFVIVLRVLSKEEIQAYAAATATLRERRRKEHEREMRGEAEPDGDRDRDREPEDEDDDKKRRHRPHRRDRDDDDRERRDRDRDRERERDRDKDRHRRHRHGSDDDNDDADRYDERSRHGHHRSHRE